MTIKLYPSLRNRNSIFNDFDNIFHDIFSQPKRYVSNNKYNMPYQTAPRANVTQNNEGFLLQLAAPGFSKNDFDINVENDVLTISVNVEEQLEENNNLVTREYSYNNFSRSWVLPEGVSPDTINARYESGILSLQIQVQNSKTIATKIQVD